MMYSYNKINRCINFSNLFLEKTLHISDGSSAHHQEFFTVHTAMVYVVQVLVTAFEQLSKTCRVLFQK